MKLIDDFLPCGGSATPGKMVKVWGIVLVMISLMTIGTHATLKLHLIYEAFAIGLVLLTMFFYRQPVSVTISGINNTMIYRSINSFGIEKKTVVDLLTAEISYKYVSLSKYKSGMKLSLYNNYNNRVILKDLYTGFTEEQMDKMVDLINKYRGVQEPVTAIS